MRGVEGCPLEVGEGQGRPLQVGVGEIRPVEASLDEIRPLKVAILQIARLEAHASEIGPAKIDCYSRVLPSPFIPSGDALLEQGNLLFIRHVCL